MNELYEKRREQMFPKLTPRQVARLEAHGRRAPTSAGEVLAEPGERHRDLLVVLSGSLEVGVPGRFGEASITALAPGDFSGELATLRGAGAQVRIRVREPGEVLAVNEENLRKVVQVDAELSEIMMRAFILRRMGLIASGEGDVMLIGSRHSAATLKLREFLSRNGHPYSSVDVDAEAGVDALLERFHVSVGDIPVVIGHCGRVFKNPSLGDVARYLNMNPSIDEARVHDVLVVGAGPAGLSAAVYAASEGLSVLVVEAGAFGGQAGSSSRIENYLGFPTGISGQALAGRAFVQAQKFGAAVSVASHAQRLRCEQIPYALELSDGTTVLARTIVIASGAQYRQPELKNLESFIGAGVYYAATHLEAKLCEGEDIAVVGGANSAGQAAVFLAGSCRHVHMMVRADGLAASMSRYLIRRIEESSNITLHTRTQIAALEGDGHLERLRLRGAEGEAARDIRHVFLMTGAVPNTGWLEGCVALDERGFVRTGEAAAEGDWPLARRPHFLETSVPGVFAVGDVRAGSTKRIATAVGEGAMCIQMAHRVLAEGK